MRTFFRALFVILAIMTWQHAQAAYLENIPRKLKQPDGSIFHCLASGDEFFNFLHDEQGYTIVRGDDGFFYYAISRQGMIIASAYRADTSDPEAKGLEKGIGITAEEYQRRVDDFGFQAYKSEKAPHTGQMNNLVVYIRFSDDTEFDTPRALFDQNFNHPQGPSVRHYFQEVSYQQLDIFSYHFPLTVMTSNISFQDTNTRGYYQPFHPQANPEGYDPEIPASDYTNMRGRTFREHTLLASAIAAIEPQVHSQIVLDANGDGNVDNVSFIIRGEPGEWANLLWAHRWVLWSQTVELQGLRVFDYTFQPETQSGVFVLCHEMFHTLGAPDLYRYSQDGFIPVGPWDLMASGFVHMGAYMKYRYSNAQWISDIPVISDPGTYTLQPLFSPESNVFSIISPNTADEFFLVEYRRRQGHYETNIPGEGLLIYRINPSVIGNAQAPPDEVYIFRPGGTLTDNGNIFQAHFSLEAGQVEFHDETDPRAFLLDDSPGGLFIANVGAAGETISFDLFPSAPGALAPRNLQAQVTDDLSVQLQWELPPLNGLSPSLAGYRIYRSQQLIKTIDDPLMLEYLDPTPAAGPYLYFIRAVYTQPDAVSYGSSAAGVTVPGYFSFRDGTTYDVGWEEGSFILHMNSNVPMWQASTNTTWSQLDLFVGNFDHQIEVSYTANPEVSDRTAQIKFKAVGFEADTVVVLNQQGHPTFVHNPELPVLEVFPNPVAGSRLMIRFLQPMGSSQLWLYSMEGREAYNMPLEAQGNEMLELSTAGLGPGIYMLVIQNGRQLIRQKVVIP